VELKTSQTWGKKKKKKKRNHKIEKGEWEREKLYEKDEEVGLREGKGKEELT